MPQSIYILPLNQYETRAIKNKGYIEKKEHQQSVQSRYIFIFHTHNATGQLAPLGFNYYEKRNSEPESITQFEAFPRILGLLTFN